MEKIKGIMDKNGICYEYRESTRPKECIDIARELSQTCDVIVAAGGDGTIFEVINGAGDADVKFFAFPLGSGNDIARSLDIHEKTEEELVEILKRGASREYDITTVNGSIYSAQFVAYGIVGEIIERYNRKKKGGKMGYYGTALKSAFTHRPKHYTVSIDGGEEKEYYADFISLQNVKTAGSGMMLCQSACDNDGVMDLVIVKRVGLRKVISNGVALMGGSIIGQSNVDTLPVRSKVTIKPKESQTLCIDGELSMSDGVTVEITGKKIRFIN